MAYAKDFGLGRPLGYPTTHDESQPTPNTSSKADFLRKQLRTELEKGRFSPSLGRNLLPGMFSMPIYAVPKPNSTDLRLVTDQSYGDFSLNSMVDHKRVTGFPLDNLSHFGEMLLDPHRTNSGSQFVVWKSDIAEAYRLMPMHPCWQIKQVNTIDGERYIDRCNAFGGSGSSGIWITFNSLVAWIAKNECGVRHLTTYVDDSSGCTTHDDLVMYEPYSCLFPQPQATLLKLWDELGIPHKEKKQLWGTSLPIIGICVDPNALSFTLPEEAKERLLNELRHWSRGGGREKLRKWFQMGGWYNWALNAYPLLRPSLNNFYPKLTGKKDSNQSIHVNNAVWADFEWAIRRLDNSTGVFLLKSIAWHVNDASYTVYCDACPKGMGFWYPELAIGFFSQTPPHYKPDLIFYFEALCVLNALWNLHKRTRVDSRFLIYTDNSNTVSIYNSLRALPDYNHLLKASIDILTQGDHDLRVLHVPGENNEVVDAISRSEFDRARNLVPNIKIYDFATWDWTKVEKGLKFLPPRDTLGAVEI